MTFDLNDRLVEEALEKLKHRFNGDPLTQSVIDFIKSEYQKKSDEQSRISIPKEEYDELLKLKKKASDLKNTTILTYRFDLTKSKPSFWWYLIVVKWLMIPRPHQILNYEMPDENLTIKELWHWCKE
ncbi:hypothetical protein IV471_00960 [Enterococcus gallinarum]|uniref:hypothetical protein n=1 Tax=Enterococcus gallinarum TaxID=1353 RepID=UPI001E41A277|nr:hypothetical protein [Enterococcus gallinarum]MCD5183864.1 hypothetical protein [Enterococcus gallinarum]